MIPNFRNPPSSPKALKAALACGVILLSGCSSSFEGVEKNEDPHVYSVSFRQLPPQPVYNRVRFVHLPEVLPSRDLPSTSGSYISSMIHLELEEASLEEVSTVLASISRYSSYCASSIASRKITLNSLGTVEDLAKEISEKAGIDVVVDHENRQVRFLAGTLIDPAMVSDEPIEPEFMERKDTGNGEAPISRENYS